MIRTKLLYTFLFVISVLITFAQNKVFHSDLPIIFTDRDGNTFQDRVIDDGTHQKALKNFPTENELIAMIEGYGTDAEFQSLIHYWCFSYTVI